MEKFLYIEINIIAIVILLLMFFNFDKTRKKAPFDQTLFIFIIWINIIILLFDVAMLLFNGQSTVCNSIVSYVYYALNPFICLIYLLYTDYKLYTNKTRLKKRLFVYSIPMLLCTVMLVANPWTGMVFNIDVNAIYQRGDYVLAFMACSFIYMIWSFVLTIIKGSTEGKSKRRDIFITFLVFPLFPIAGTIVQFLFYGVSLMWITTALSILVVFINIQNKQLSTDTLTGIFNRFEYEKLLDSRDFANDDKVHYVMLFDLDKFKALNDKYGHSKGDEALIAFANALCLSFFERDDFIARIGGDEFVVLCQRRNIEELHHNINILQEIIEKYNKDNNKYKIEYSYGIASNVAGQENLSRTELVKLADAQMYEMKQKKYKHSCQEDDLKKLKYAIKE